MISETGSQKKRGLGMGLSALLGADDHSSQSGRDGQLQTVPIEFLRASPFQPRRHFDEEELHALADSIRSKGILQPLVVRPTDGAVPGYEIIAGERRWRASQIAGLHEVPAIVRTLDDRAVLEIALIENLQREDLSPIEEAIAFQKLLDEFGHTQEELGAALSKSRSHIANTLRLLKLPPEVRKMVEDGRLSAGHARALVTSEDALTLARIVVEKELTVRETEELAKRKPDAAEVRNKPDPEPADPNVLAAEKYLADRLGLKVDIRAKKRGGTLVIHYRTGAQLDHVISRLAPEVTNQ
ncbi:MAG: ParB/RepB/Spo0J family partition protein [Geminicoccaceae bacterium]|nr:ParB/RepB/Spo0J family partition protein [Geminicoccaceae bacterium]